MRVIFIAICALVCSAKAASVPAQDSAQQQLIALLGRIASSQPADIYTCSARVKGYECAEEKLALLSTIASDLPRLKRIKFVPTSAFTEDYSSRQIRQILSGCWGLDLKHKIIQSLHKGELFYSQISAQNAKIAAGSVQIDGEKYLFVQLISPGGGADFSFIKASLCERAHAANDALKLAKSGELKVPNRRLDNAFLITYKNEPFMLNFSANERYLTINIDDVSDLLSDDLELLGYGSWPYKKSTLKTITFKLQAK